MKNKFKFLNFHIIFFLTIVNLSAANEVFNFDVKEIEIKEGNRFIGKNGGTAKSVDGTTITAENFDYKE